MVFFYLHFSIFQLLRLSFMNIRAETEGLSARRRGCGGSLFYCARFFDGCGYNKKMITALSIYKQSLKSIAYEDFYYGRTHPVGADAPYNKANCLHLPYG